MFQCVHLQSNGPFIKRLHPKHLKHVSPKSQHALMHGKRVIVRAHRPHEDKPKLQVTLQHKHPNTHHHSFYSRTLAVLEADERRHGELEGVDFKSSKKEIEGTDPRNANYPLGPVWRRGPVRLQTTSATASTSTDTVASMSSSPTQMDKAPELNLQSETGPPSTTPSSIHSSSPAQLLTSLVHLYTDKALDPMSNHLVAPFLRTKLAGKVEVSTKALRTMDKKGGLDEYLLTTPDDLLGETGRRMRAELKLAIATMYARGLAKDGQTTELAFQKGLIVPQLADSAFGVIKRSAVGGQHRKNGKTNGLLDEIEKLKGLDLSMQKVDTQGMMQAAQ